MDKQKTIEALQFFVTNLSDGAFAHKLQGQIFQAQGFTKLADKYIAHYTEEMGWVEQFVNRILDLGGEVKLEDRKGRELITDAIAYIKADHAIQQPGVELLRKCMGTLVDDPITYDLLTAYLKDEEEDLFWSEAQFDLIEKIGLQNWYLRQL